VALPESYIADGIPLGSPSGKSQLRIAVLSWPATAFFSTTQILGAKHMLVQDHVGYENAATSPNNQSDPGAQQLVRNDDGQSATSITSVCDRGLAVYVSSSTSTSHKTVTNKRCTHQIIRQNDFASFNVLGLAIIFVVGGLIIVLNLSLSAVVNKIQQGTPKGQYRIKKWDINGTLKLQRLAFQHHGANFETAARDPASSNS
jgi:hypothetical protein